ncbi:hypothetical protein MCO_00214 [Bartonella sp. DB5-6]|uniref:hypothetical protein n=1 Tax=Bartonella sp. DB5-6 TaxID=1094755 RepID=UPI00026E912D|nr:hypothetical protein [Bartonella sp. DB5-6]EJF80700.1 hypothetical protein MCO_00214 [Bartonella sp. DB5-6]
MHRKLRISFCALMTGSFFVKIAKEVTALGEQSLASISVSEQLGKMGKKLVSENLTIKNGTVETVGNGNVSKGTLLVNMGCKALSMEDKQRRLKFMVVCRVF